MAVEWDDLIPSKVFTRIKTNFAQSLKTKYKMTDKNFSTVGSSDAPAVFPFVSIQLLSETENARTLKGTTINSANFGFQIDIYDNQSDNRAEEVAREVKRIMKSMAFYGSKQPSQSSKGTYRKTYRFSRIICSGDIL